MNSQIDRENLFHPVVVIGIPLYNEQRYIGQTLDSVLAQTYSDFLVVISDNCSTDKSSEICLSYTEADSRICYVRHRSNLGALMNFEYLFNVTQSPFFMWLGAHDCVHPTFLARHVDKLKADDSLSLSCSQIEWIDEENRTTRMSHLQHINRYSMPNWARYLIAVLSVPDDEYIVVNSLFRRSCLNGYRFKATFGIDHIIVSRLNYMGKVNYEAAPLYIARCFKEARDESWEERVDTKTPSDCFDMKLFRQVYEEDLARLTYGNQPLYRQPLRLLFRLCLDLRIAKISYDYGSLRIRPFPVFLFLRLCWSLLPLRTGLALRLRVLAQHLSKSI